ncbi:MAG: hypothetical protein ACQSGP_10340, partial [Frankia sp.]
MVLGDAGGRTAKGVAPFPAGSVVPYLGPVVTAETAAQAPKRSGGVIFAGVKGLTRVSGLRLRGSALVDPAAYEAEATRKPRDDANPGLFPLDPSGAWLERQRNAGLASLLTDGQLVGAGDREALARGLSRCAEARGPTVAVLPLTYHWLRGDDLTALIAAVRAAGRPVALVLANAFNALDRAGAVAGLVRLIREVDPVPVSILRCDISAVGAVAYGAALGAVGLKPGTRHYALPGPPPVEGRKPDRSDRLFVPGLFDYFKASRFPAFFAADPAVLDCDCQVCKGRSLLRFTEQSDAGGVELHNLHATEDVARAV